ncbi:STAS domain-containing protein [Actinomycetospora sp. TBRC 11914]|uniref:STAS domain-containing protein n=1 Tax=Actinomycetospora sp. TBRC 11914 TaxID=2729387 RepID=UPI00145F67E3|nr:STAS domain-containing protein [Actinomycetospora sp. TBRC 11914]NMO88322.1 STAS domain-containing protein [Actinomycetospora sp. TBRC 11914]
MKPDDDQLDPGLTGPHLDPAPDPWGTSGGDRPAGVRVLRVGATLDAAAAAQLRREARGLLARSAEPLVVDLTAVRAVDRAAASGALRELAYEAGDADVDLRVVRDPGTAEVTGALLDDETLFELFPTLDAALRHPADAGGPQQRRHPGHPPAAGGR